MIWLDALQGSLLLTSELILEDRFTIALFFWSTCINYTAGGRITQHTANDYVGLWFTDNSSALLANRLFSLAPIPKYFRAVG